MNIISWNANSTTRYAQLWLDPEVLANNWDVICLQESGNPVHNWVHVAGPAWTNNRSTSESIVKRIYTCQPAGLPQLFIVHGEWPNRQKNHLVIVTKTQPTWAADLSGQAGERPALGIKLRVDYGGGNVRTILVGTVHIVASSGKAPAEVGEMAAYVEAMKTHTQCDGWLLIGDFNCSPLALGGSVSGICDGRWPNAHTQGVPFADKTIDYLIFSPRNLIGNGQHDSWVVSGQTKSDHHLISFQHPGNVVTIV